jgi:hypothetical protein
MRTWMGTVVMSALFGAACGDAGQAGDGDGERDPKLPGWQSPAEDPVDPIGPGAWSDPAPLAGTEGVTTRPLVTADADGRAVAVWSQQRNEATGAVHAVMASRHDGVAWQAPVVVADGLGYVYGLQLAGDDRGRAVAVWLTYDETSSIMASRYESDTGAWESPQTIGNGDMARAARGANGDAVIVWRTDAGLSGRLAQRGGPWLASSAVAAGAVADAWDEDGGTLDVRMDPAGRILVVWVERGTETVLWARRGAQTLGSNGVLEWRSPERLASYARQGAVPRVWGALDPEGRAALVWMEIDDQTWTYRLMTTQALDGAAFAAPEAITGSIAMMYGLFQNDARAARSHAGHLAALWRDEVDGQGRILTARFVPGAGWASPDVVIDDHEPPIGCTFDGNAEAADIAVDASGQAVAVWEERDPDVLAIEVAAAQYSPATGWGPRTRLGSGASGLADGPAPALGRAGYAVWKRREQVEGGGSLIRVWTSRLDRTVE